MPTNEEMITLHREAAEQWLDLAVKAGQESGARIAAIAAAHATLATHYLLEEVCSALDEPSEQPE